jgi:hypothetical protein
MALSDVLNWFGSGTPTTEIPNIYPMPILSRDFVSTDVRYVYSRILTDVLERTTGIKDEQMPLLWDNCSASESSEGVVTMLSRAMTEKNDLFLVYDKSVQVVRVANATEAQQIKNDYQVKNGSSVGTYVTFKKYDRTDMIKFYSSLEYVTVSGLYKTMNLSTAIQLKLNDLRSSVGAIDGSVIQAQALLIAQGLGAGKDVMLDAKDTVESSKPDLTAINQSMNLIVEKRAFYLGMPASYITVITSKGLGDSGQADAKQIDRGLKNYYFSVVKPAIESLFGIKTEFKSEDLSQVANSMEVLKTFDVTSEEYVSKDNKTKILNKVFGLPEDSKGDAPKKVEPLPALPIKTPVPPQV